MRVADDNKAAEYLRRIGYYRLSAYWHPMRQRSEGGVVEDNFVPGTTFKEATDLYAFDSRLRLLTLDALERLEVSLRTEVALTLGRHGPNAYRETKHFSPAFRKPTRGNGPTKHREWLSRFDKRFRESKDAFAEHFRVKYPGDDMPIWIAVELLDFGPLSHLLGGMSYADLRLVGTSYGDINPKKVMSWARSMAFARNVCAHHARLWNRPLVNAPSLSGEDCPVDLAHVREAPGKETRYYSIACVLSYMLRHANPRTSWRRRFIDHVVTFPTSERLSLASAGFPSDWQEQEIWK